MPKTIAEIKTAANELNRRAKMGQVDERGLFDTFNSLVNYLAAVTVAGEAAEPGSTAAQAAPKAASPVPQRPQPRLHRPHPFLAKRPPRSPPLPRRRRTAPRRPSQPTSGWARACGSAACRPRTAA